MNIQKKSKDGPRNLRDQDNEEKHEEKRFSIWRILFIMDFAAAAKLLQSCLPLCDPIDGSPPSSLIPAILQARTLEWVAISFSNAWKWKVEVKCSVMSDSQQPHGLKPARLLHPWDFPDKSAGVGCHCLLYNGLWVIDNWVEIWGVIGDVVRLGNVFSCMEWHSEMTYDLGFASSRDWHGQACKAWNDLYYWLPGKTAGVIRFR